jgi:hypothetical protein
VIFQEKLEWIELNSILHRRASSFLRHGGYVLMWYRSRTIEKCLLCCYAGASESCTIQFTKPPTTYSEPQPTEHYSWWVQPALCTDLRRNITFVWQIEASSLDTADRKIPCSCGVARLKAYRQVIYHPITRHSKHYATCDLEYNYSNFRVPICPSITLYFNSLY